MNYKQEIEKFVGTMYAQELKFTERMIRDMKWKLPDEPITEEFFWDQFMKNQQALAYMFYLHEMGTDSWHDLNRIPQHKVDAWVKKSIEDMKKDPEISETRDDEIHRIRTYVIIRSRIGDLPMTKTKAGTVAWYVFLFLVVCAIALCIKIPILGIPMLLLLGWFYYLILPKKH